MDAVAVELVRPGIRQKPVPDHVGLLRQRNPSALDLRVRGVEEAKLDLGGMRREQREIDADSGPGSSEGIGVAGPHSHNGSGFTFCAIPTRLGARG
jgi:hypothetical protein